MHKKIILRWAKEAGMHHAFDTEGHWDGLTDVQLIERHPPHPNDIVYAEKRIVEILERFATIVADATIKASQDYKLGYADGVFAEREALAAEAEKNGNIILAMQIRARGNT